LRGRRAGRPDPNGASLANERARTIAAFAARCPIGPDRTETQAILQQLEPKRGIDPWNDRAAMTKPLLTLFLAGFGLSGIAGQAAAQSRGAIGAQSRATVGISVSVAPRFFLPAGATPGPSIDSAPLLLESNAPMLRYRIELQPLPGDKAPAAATARRPQLLLIVPD